MPTMQAGRSSPTDADIFLRLWDQEQLTPTLAHHLLKLKFSDEDLERMHELAQKNSAGEIKPREVRELDQFIRASEILSVLQSRARKLLKRQPA